MTAPAPASAPPDKSPQQGASVDRSGPTRKAIIGWTAVMFLVLSVVWVVAGVVVPHYRSLHLVDRVARTPRPPSWDHQVAALGGREEAVAHIERYLRIPEKWAHSRAYAVQLLGYCSDAAVPVLIRATRDKDPSVRLYAIYYLCRKAPETPALERIAREAITDDDARVRQAAAEALEKIKAAQEKKP
jgi:hypothetical protein